VGVRVTSLDISDQLQNVLDGYTADGHPRPGGPIAFAGKTEAVMAGLVVLVLFRDLRDHIPEDLERDAIRTAAILTLVRWLNVTRLTTSRKLLRLLYRVGPPAHSPMQ
jgi:hypothetical protein